MKSLLNLGAPDPFIVSVFSEMIASLLPETSTVPEDSSLANFSLFKKRQPSTQYAFLVKDSLSWIEKFLQKDKRTAMAYLDAFLEGHFLYAPKMRALHSSPSNSIELQPTPKGIALLEKWYNQQGGKMSLCAPQQRAVEQLLQSPLNSMSLTTLERSLLTRKLKLSTGLAMVLWTRIMGRVPQHFDSNLRNSVGVSPSSQESIQAESANRNSPFYTRAMLHPNSCHLLQYWNSAGMRLFSNLRFEKAARSRFASPSKYQVDFVISGKALLQWIMDCTTVESYQEGIRIAKLVLDQGFLKLISDPPVDAFAAANMELATKYRNHEDGEFLATALYRLTPRGSRMLAWEHLIDDSWLDKADLEMEYQAAEAMLNAATSTSAASPMHSKTAPSSESADWKWEHQTLPEVQNTFSRLITLQVIQSEPGLKLLFREELASLMCPEPLDFLDLAQQILLLVSAAKNSQGTVTRRVCLESQASGLLARLCNQYLVVGAPAEINLSEKDRAALLNATNTFELEMLSKSLSIAQTRCADLLRDAIVYFKNSDVTREIPSLRTYVVAKFFHSVEDEKAADLSAATEGLPRYAPVIQARAKVADT